jgi:hypothetical protein
MRYIYVIHSCFCVMTICEKMVYVNLMDSRGYIGLIQIIPTVKIPVFKYMFENLQ